MERRFTEEIRLLRLGLNAFGKLKNDSDALVDPLRAIDNRRIASGPSAQCPPAFLRRLYMAIADILHLPIAQI